MRKYVLPIVATVLLLICTWLLSDRLYDYYPHLGYKVITGFLPMTVILCGCWFYLGTQDLKTKWSVYGYLVTFVAVFWWLISIAAKFIADLFTNASAPFEVYANFILVGGVLAISSLHIIKTGWRPTPES